jgi:hypothetical protein
MNYIKKVIYVCFLLYTPHILTLIPQHTEQTLFSHYAYAEKEEFITSDEEFLPLGTELDDEVSEMEEVFLKDETLIKNASIEGIKILTEEKELLFTFDAADEAVFEDKELKYTIVAVDFPPRIIITLYGVKSEERAFRFFKNLDILGVVLNPFVDRYRTEYVFFFQDWTQAESAYDKENRSLTVKYTLTVPEFRRGYGVRIADTRIDPLPQVIEIHNEIQEYGLESYLLIASDYETVVLESPFYKTREEAIDYIESLVNFGYEGKLAIRDYTALPEPNRFDVVSEVVITGDDSADLKNIVYTEMIPQKTHILSFSDLYILTKDIFSPSVQNDENKMAEYYYKLSDLYLNYETEDSEVREMATLVAVKILEVIYFHFPKSQRADDALWEIGDIAREQGIRDALSESECYKKILTEYPTSIFTDEVKERLAETG